MCKRYYSNYDEMKDTALSYRQDWFRVERHTSECECGTMHPAFTISDREDDDIIEKMVCCQQCAEKQKSTLKTV